MARVQYVKRAQQKFETKPVIDPATGEQKITPMINSRTGKPKVDKNGNPVVLRITERDLSKPKPLEVCEKCRTTIQPGQPYKWVAPKNQPARVRCGDCPTWQPWDLSSALWARIAQIQNDFDVSTVETPDEVSEALSEMAEEVRGLAEEKGESAQNIEDGFGHPTSQSEELQEQADELEAWADEIENVSVPDLPEPEEGDCEECGGTGTTPTPLQTSEACEACDGTGTGTVTPEEPTDDQMEEWRAEVEEACSVTQESPV